MEKIYAQAIMAQSQKPDADATALVKSLIAHLTETGRIKLLPRILLELKRLSFRADAFGELLEIAHERERKVAEQDAKEFGIESKAIVNASLVRGWRARIGSRIIDRSGKRALLDLYRSIVKAA